MGIRPQRAQYYEDQGWWTSDRVGDLVGLRAATAPLRELFLFDGRRITYGQFNSWVHRVAADLVAHGVGSGDRVLVQLPNCLEALVMQVAALRIGALTVPVIPIYRQHEVAQIIAESPPAAIAVAARIRERSPHLEIDEIAVQLGVRPHVKYLVGDTAPGWRNIPALDSDDPPMREQLPDPAPADKPAVVLYTSGTTSAPKGAILSSRSLIAQLRNMAASSDLDELSVLAAGTPLSHLGGFIAGLLLPAFLGARTVILPAWRPDEAVQIIEEERVTMMMGATVFLQDLVSRYSAGAAPTHRLARYMCAGSTIPSTLIEAADSVGVFATRHYGMTETAGICTGAARDDSLARRASWDGRLLLGMEIQAVDDDGLTLANGCEGELRIRGPQLFDGYTDSAVTADQFDDDGWFQPGDIGIVDDGWIRITGRSKDIVNRGGEKFSTYDIETAILSHHSVAAAAVTAVPHERLGETVGAWIVLADGNEWAGPDALLRHLDTARLAKAKMPAEWHVVEAIPTTATGKVQKSRLRELPDIATNTDVRLDTTERTSR